MAVKFDEIRHRAFCAYLDEAEALFRKNPKAAYAKCRKLAAENMAENSGKYGQKSPEYDAYDTAAIDYGNGAL